MNRLIQFELKKIVSRRLTQIALAAVLLLSVLYACSTYQNMYASDGRGREGSGRTAVEIDQSIAAKYEGTLTDEKVRQMMSDFSVKQDLQGVNAAYVYQNAMQSAAFARFSDLDGNWNGLGVSDVFGEETIQVGYTCGWLETSRNLRQIFIILALVIIIMIAPVFSGEYSGVDNIILTSRFGKTKCTAAKAIAGILTAMAVTAVVSAVNLGLAMALYGAGGWDGSILFAPIEFIHGYIPFNISCGTLLKYQILLAFTGALGVTGITLLLSAACKNQIGALVSSAAVFIVPIMLPVAENSPVFRYIALCPLYQVEFVSIMSIEQMHGGLLYAVWGVPVALILAIAGCVFSRRIFARHQVNG